MMRLTHQLERNCVGHRTSLVKRRIAHDEVERFIGVAGKTIGSDKGRAHDVVGSCVLASGFDREKRLIKERDVGVAKPTSKCDPKHAGATPQIRDPLHTVWR